MSFFNSAVGEGVKLGGSLIGGYFSSRENRKARKALAAGGQRANAYAQEGYDESIQFLDDGLARATGILNPYIQSGNKGQKLYHDALGLNGEYAQQSFHDDFQNDAGFQDAVDFSADQVERSYGTRGGVNSGRAMIALADNARKAQLGAYQNRLSRLEGVSNQGYNASRDVSNYEFNTGTNKSNLRTGLGNTLSANAINSAGGQAQYHSNNANIVGSTLSGVSNAFGNYLGGNSVNEQTANTQQTDYTNPFYGMRDLNSYTGQNQNQLGSNVYQPALKSLNNFSQYF